MHLALKVTPEQFTDAKRLMASAALETVRLIHVRAAHMAAEGCPVKAMPEKAMPSASAKIITDGNRFRVVFGHSLHGGRGAEDATEVQIDASFELVYSFPKEMDPPPNDKELKAFADTNAVMNCWPYWRELVQSTVARMNLPPLLVPLLRFVPPVARPKPAQSATAGKSKETQEVPRNALDLSSEGKPK